MTYTGVKNLPAHTHLVVPVSARSTAAKEIGNPISKVQVECVSDVGFADAEGSGDGKGVRDV